MLIRKKLDRAEFYRLLDLPENADNIFDLIDGEMVEQPPRFGFASAVSARLAGLFGLYLLNHPVAHITDAQGGYELDDENTLIPDVGIILKSHLAEVPDDQFIPMPPDIAVEVVSKSDLEKRKERIDKKLIAYRAAGVPLTLYVYPDRREVEVYRPGQSMQIVGVDGVIDCGDVLPGFMLRVGETFVA